MVCEYMEHSLKGLLERKISLRIEQIRCIMKQILEGLIFLHSCHIMHRDIKCSNILMNSAGEVKLADFGMGTVFAPNAKYRGSKTVVTLWYRAPEILLGQDYTEAIDVWALGCVFGELLLGTAVFNKGCTEEEQISLILFLLLKCKFLIPNFHKT